MFVSSVSTILFNANPLLRYDGYYILSDMIEIPNLRQKATTILTRKLGSWCLGLEEPDDPFLPKRHQWLFALYTIAAVFYRWFIVLSILFFLNKVFEPYGLKVIGQIDRPRRAVRTVPAADLEGLQVLLGPRETWQSETQTDVHDDRPAGAALAAILFIPLPAAVYCPLVMQPRGAEPVYVEVPGTLIASKVRPGDTVKKNQLLAQLKNIEIDVQIAEQNGEMQRLEARLHANERLQHEDESAARVVVTTRAALRTATEQLAQLEEDRDRLRLFAPRDGVVIPPPASNRPAAGPGELLEWNGTPLDKENIGATLIPGEQGLFCLVGDLDKLEAHLAINQADIEFVDDNFLPNSVQVEIILDQDVDRAVVLQGTISEIVREKLKVAPRQLAAHAGGPLPTEVDSSGVPRPLDTTYQATVPIQDSTGGLRPGLIGTAKIHTRPRTLASRLWRYVSATFSFEL